MGALKMDNNRTHSIINEIELIIEGSFPDSDDNKQRLLRCFPQYRAAAVIIRKNTDLTEEEIATFQDHINAWFCDWVKVYGKEGCTNTHMLSSGHVMQYMKEWKCLNCYSQQGWEALNALIALFEDDDDSSESSIESGNDETTFNFEKNYELASEEMSDIED
jgi:hypothetical protein